MSFTLPWKCIRHIYVSKHKKYNSETIHQTSVVINQFLLQITHNQLYSEPPLIQSTALSEERFCQNTLAAYLYNKETFFEGKSYYFIV
jgi:hypothetical protein